MVQWVSPFSLQRFVYITGELKIVQGRSVSIHEDEVHGVGYRLASPVSYSVFQPRHGNVPSPQRIVSSGMQVNFLFPT